MTTITQTTNKIQALTPEQLTAMPEYVNKWASIGLSTEPTDEEKGTAAIVKMYEIAGLLTPRVYWFDSPLAAMSAAAMIRCLGLMDIDIEQEFQTKNQVLAEVFAQKLYQVKDYMSSQMISGVKKRMAAQALNQACNQVRTHIRDQMFNQALNQVDKPACYQAIKDAFDHTSGQMIDQVRNPMKAFKEAVDLARCYRYWELPGGLGTARTCALYDFFANAMHLDIGYEKLAGIIGVAEQASIVYTFRDCAFAVRKMRKCSLDEQGRPHCEDGPAILFNDGFAIYARHGEVLFRKEW